MKKLTREFYNRTSLEVAKDILGKYLVHAVEDEKVIGRIVETEAYMGPMDKAAHSYNNRRTKRTEVMFGPPGHAYVYVIYGMYYCMNIVTAEEGKPQAVLIRSVEPVSNLERMAKLRYKKNLSDLGEKEIIGLGNGPGKLCLSMGITAVDNGTDLCGDSFYVAEDDVKSVFQVVTAKRINIDYAEEAALYPWRFYIKGNRFVSKK